MAITNKDTLKGYFKAGSIPTESNFADLIDSLLSENGNNLLFIDNAKTKIGIGTETPAAKLDVGGRISLQTAEGRNYFKDIEKNDGGGLRVGAAWGMYGIYAENGVCAVGGVEGISLQNGIVNVKKTGSVGIGIANPSQKLEIGGNGGLGFSGPNLNAADKKLYSPADGDLEWMTHNAAGTHGFAISHQGTKAVYLSTSGNSYLIGGNVGIGTNTPSHKLHVTAEGAVGLFESTTDQAYLRLSTKEGIGRRVEFCNRPGGRAAIWVSTAGDALNVLHNGNVGIGTVSPAQRFHVEGAAKIDGAVYAGNSDIYFSETAHNHTGIGNQPNWAAIENSSNYKCLMILGRNVGAEGSLKRVVKVWDELWVADRQVSASDMREKTNIEPLQYGLQTIHALRPVMYNWIKNKNGQKNLGLIAQEVLPVVKEAVHYDEANPDEPGWGISYQSLIPVLINAIKELDMKLRSIQGQQATAIKAAFD